MTDAPSRHAVRFTSWLLLAAGVLLVAGNSAHPVDSDPSPISRLDLAGDASWVVVHLVITVGVLLAAGGLGGLSRLITRPVARDHAAFGATAALIGATMLAIVFGGLDGYGASTLAADWQQAAGEERLVLESAAVALDAADSGITAIGVIALFGLALGSFGRALVLDRLLPAWLGWVALALGVLGLVTGVTWALEGPTSLTINLLFRPLALAATVWFLAVGVTLRRVRVPEPVGEPAGTPA
jgi:hypothetical protein